MPDLTSFYAASRSLKLVSVKRSYNDKDGNKEYIAEIQLNKMLRGTKPVDAWLIVPRMQEYYSRRSWLFLTLQNLRLGIRKVYKIVGPGMAVVNEVRTHFLYYDGLIF